MLALDKNIKLFQTLPAQGWRVLVRVKRGPDSTNEEFPVVAWASFRDDVGGPVKFAPIISGPAGLLFGNGPEIVYLAPGEERTKEHDRRLFATRNEGEK